MNLKINREKENGNIEYKLKLINTDTEKIQRLTSQMRYRIQEGSGEAIYVIGVTHEGGVIGVTEDEFTESFNNLSLAAKDSNYNINILSSRIVEKDTNKKVYELLVREINEHKYIDIKVSVAGNVVQNVFPLILAYYFPQFHSIPENDSVFGEGFNDWDLFKLKNNNEHLKSCKFPIDLPEGLGFYDPTLKDIRKKQGSLAKKYGVDGFIYYHYWLENHPVMNKVVDNLIEDNEPDIPFCLCFANDSWRHCYSIKDKPISFHSDGSTYRQLYDKPSEHAYYLHKIFKHKNYIKIDNKPILFIYRSCTGI